MKKRIFWAGTLVLLLVGLSIGVPFAKYKSLDKVASFWGEMLGGTSSFNPGKSWQDLKATGGNFQSEARQIPGVSGSADLLGKIWGEIQKAVGTAWDLPAGQMLPFLKNTPFEKLGLGLLLLVIAVIVLGTISLLVGTWRGANKVGGKYINSGQQQAKNFFDDLWINLIRILALVGLGANFFYAWSKKPDGPNEAITSTVLPIFLIVFAIPWAWEKFRALSIPGLEMPFWHKWVEFLFVVVVITMGFAAFIGSQDVFVGVTKWIGEIPYIGGILKSLIDVGIKIGVKTSFVIGSICVFLLVKDRVVAQKLSKTPI